MPSWLQHWCLALLDRNLCAYSALVIRYVAFRFWCDKLQHFAFANCQTPHYSIGTDRKECDLAGVMFYVLLFQLKEATWHQRRGLFISDLKWGQHSFPVRSSHVGVRGLFLEHCWQWSWESVFANTFSVCDVLFWESGQVNRPDWKIIDAQL